jgi:hypothetical protein
MPSLMVTTESLYDAFDGVDGTERIKRGIYEAYWRLGVRYVLLAGDAQKLPVVSVWQTALPLTTEALHI